MGLMTNSSGAERKEDVQWFRKALGFATKSSPCSKTGQWDVTFEFAHSKQESFIVDAQDRRSLVPPRAKLIQLGQKKAKSRGESVTLLLCKTILQLQLQLDCRTTHTKIAKLDSKLPFILQS